MYMYVPLYGTNFFDLTNHPDCIVLLQYVVENGGQTLLPQYIGMYRLTLNNVEHYMIVTRNVMSSTLKTHKKYDLKVSTVGHNPFCLLPYSLSLY